MRILGHAGLQLELKELYDDCYVTPHVVKHLGLPCKKMRYPYYDEKGYLVDRWANISFSSGEYFEEVWCHVIPMDTCDLCVGLGLFEFHEVPKSSNWLNFVMDNKGHLLFPPDTSWIAVSRSSVDEDALECLVGSPHGFHVFMIAWNEEFERVEEEESMNSSNSWISYTIED